jgi:hypothetical protein
MQQFLILISSISVFISYLIYEWAMVKGRARPHRTTRLVILIITAVGASSLFAQNDRVVFIFLGICAVQSLVMFAMSLKWGMGGWAKIDILCLAVALLGVVLWRVTSDPALALYACVIADLAGMVPALVKTYRLPGSEYYLSYIFDLVAIVLTILAIRNGGFNEYLYPTYLVIVNSLMLVFISRRTKRLIFFKK